MNILKPWSNFEDKWSNNAHYQFTEESVLWLVHQKCAEQYWVMVQYYYQYVTPNEPKAFIAALKDGLHNIKQTLFNQSVEKLTSSWKLKMFAQIAKLLKKSHQFSPASIRCIR
jgi:hypothetical protein